MYKKLLLFQINPKKTNALKALCATLRPQLDIKVVEVAKTQYGQSLGFLAGIDGFAEKKERYTGLPFPGEMLVFSGLTDSELDTVLTAWNKNGPERVALKAVLTPDNIHWTPERLFRELLGHISGQSE